MTRHHLLFALQALVTVVLLGLLFHGFDWQAFWQLLHRVPWWFYAISFATVLAGQVLYAFRWYLVLVALEVPVTFTAAFEQFLVGLFFNNFLPSTMGGDSAKVYYLGRTEGYVRVTASVLVDRVIGVFVVATLAILLVSRIDHAAPAVAATKGVLTLTWFVLAAMMLVAIALPPGLWLSGFVRRWRWLERSADRVKRLVIHAQAAVRHPVVLAGSSIVVVTYFFLLGLIYQEFVVLATGARPALLPVIAVVATIATLSNFPVAVNGLGLREQLHLALFATFGLTREAAAGISLLLFAHLLAASAVGAVIWLRGPVPRPVRVQEADGREQP